MRKAADIFYRMCLILTLFFTGVIFILTFTILDGTQPRHEAYGNLPVHLPAVMATVFFMAAALVFVYRRFGKWIQKQSMSIVLFLLLIVVQVLFLVFVSHPMYTTDALNTQNEAAAMLVSQNGLLNMESSYFQIYPNNHFIVVLFYYYFSLLDSLGITQFWISAVVINVICIDSSILLSYASVRKLWDVKTGNLFLVLCLLCPTTYVWLTFTYTNTVSMPFVMGILYLFLRLQEPVLDIRQMILSICLGVCIITGYKIRPTTLLPVIALVLYAVMKGIWQKEKYGIRIRFLKAGAVVLAGILTAFSFRMLLNKHVAEGYEDKGMPASHWVMMGLNDKSDGGFNMSDRDFSRQFPTKAEKKSANIKEIGRRLQELGPGGCISLLRRKLVRVWADGSDASFRKSAYATDFPVLYEKVMGRQNIGFRIYTQAFRGLTFFFIGAGTLALALRRNRKDTFVYTLTLLGCIAFFLLWEANTKYNICFIYLCLLLMADGIRMTETGLAYAGKRRKTAGMFSGMGSRVLKLSFWTGCAVLLCISTYSCAVSGCNISQVYQAELKRKGSWSKKLLKHAECITQTMQKGQETDGCNFNELILLFEPSDTPQADDRYHLAVYAMPEGSVLYETDITKEDVGQQGLYTFTADMERKTEDAYYVLELRHYGKKYSMYPCLQKSAYLDMYPYGTVAVDGHTLDCDLRFGLYQNSLAEQ